MFFWLQAGLSFVQLRIFFFKKTNSWIHNECVHVSTKLVLNLFETLK